MWAIIECGSKQYKVEEGESLYVERIKKPSPDNKISIDKVLLLVKDSILKVGRPYLKNVKVTAEILKEEKDKKIIVFKYKRRKNYRRKKGHRQIYTLLKILKIEEKE
ncbi:MAG: 50S ribosomal protein L21 [Candidatus Omnitrophica bacterium]|nr:50S ribosomal protein L21 [Candidatus Omnitrophota bacterium]